MAKVPWISSYRGRNYRRFLQQKSLIEKHFPCFKCRFLHRQWHCEGKIVPSEGCDTYKISIMYRLGATPRVRIIEPQIAPSSAIHIYNDGSLCLYQPSDQPWMTSDNIHEKIIPWTAEWLVFYELYKISGKWLGPEAPHGINENGSADKQAQNRADGDRDEARLPG